MRILRRIANCMSVNGVIKVKQIKNNNNKKNKMTISLWNKPAQIVGDKRRFRTSPSSNAHFRNFLSSFIIVLNSLSFFRKSGLLSKVSHIHTRPSRHHLRCAGKTLSLLRNSDLSTLENVILTHVTFFCFFCFLFLLFSLDSPSSRPARYIRSASLYITTLVTDFN